MTEISFIFFLREANFFNPAPIFTLNYELIKYYLLLNVYS